jgi:hypothetical protein
MEHYMKLPCPAARKLIDANKLEKGRVLISVSGKLYAITTDGYLYEIEFTN